MPKFVYLARDSKGNKIRGTEEVPSYEDLLNRLQTRNLLVIEINSAEQEERTDRSKPEKRAFKLAGRRQHYGIKSDDLVVFCRQLSTLLSAGVTILKSLDVISKQVSSRKLYIILQDLTRDMESGLSFNEALAKHKSTFPELWINLVESGEASGNLAAVLSRLASYLERSANFKKKIISSLMYPVLLFIVGLGALLFLTLQIIPTFAELFEGFEITLPLITQVLILSSLIIRKFSALFIITGVIIFFAFRVYIKTKEGRKVFEKFRFNLPLFGKFFRELMFERFSSDIGTLIGSGVPLLYSLEIAEHSISNLTLAEIIHKIKDDVREGKLLSVGMEKSGFFDSMFTQMTSVGEEVGDLPQMFKRINEYYQESTETFLSRFATIFEPLMLIFMGGVIGIMVLGIFLPIFQIATAGV
ncbi:MAG: hypothetical protein DRP74_06010 [Candidatus Omnitrophota bacterium]|nr:MAG: hypothetical protein DRP74_06010 [Candidatus Omnitrophota bacterium]